MGGGEIAGAQPFFQREELRAVGCIGGDGVVQGEEQSVIVGYPEKARRLDAVAHGDAVGDHSGDVGLIQHPGGVVRALRALTAARAALSAATPAGVSGYGGDVIESEPGVGELWVVGAVGDGIGLRGHAVDGEGIEVAVVGIGGRGEDGVGVVVERRGGEDEM